MIAVPEHPWTPHVVSRNYGEAVGSKAATDASAILGRCMAVTSVPAAAPGGRD